MTLTRPGQGPAVRLDPVLRARRLPKGLAPCPVLSAPLGSPTPSHAVAPGPSLVRPWPSRPLSQA